MQAIVWWIIPVVATVVAVVWVSIANRPRPPADTTDSVAEHERFRAAMERTLHRAPLGGQLEDEDDDDDDGVDDAERDA